MLRKSARLLMTSGAARRRSAVLKPAVRWQGGSVTLNAGFDGRSICDEQNTDREGRDEPREERNKPREGRNKDHQERKDGRKLFPEVLYGFSVLSLAGVWATKDDKDASINNKDASSRDQPKTDVKTSSKPSLPRFGLLAAEPLGPGSGGGEGKDGIGKEPTRRQKNNFIADVVSETAPALVFIEIKDAAHRDFFTGKPVTSSNGSGFIVKSDGLILTNAHVVINKPRAAIQVRLQSGDVFAGTVEDVDVKSDLATVRIQCHNLPVMKLGSSSDLRPGEFVVAMGSPLSLSNTITTGVVSNVARPPGELGLEGRDIPEYIQTDAAITFGNSGGPLINLDGEAIGINSMKVTPGISFAIPIDYAKEFLKKSEEAGKSGWPAGKRRYIGITMVSLSPQMIDELKYRGNIPPSVTHGILIYRMVVGSPADRSGLRPGDIISHINDAPVYGSRDVYKILESQETPLSLTVSRDNKIFTVQLQPENTL